MVNSIRVQFYACIPSISQKRLKSNVLCDPYAAKMFTRDVCKYQTCVLVGFLFFFRFRRQAFSVVHRCLSVYRQRLLIVHNFYKYLSATVPTSETSRLRNWFRAVLNDCVPGRGLVRIHTYARPLSRRR